MNPMPQNSTSRPRTTWAIWDSPRPLGADFVEGLPAGLAGDLDEAGRRLPDGGVFTLERPPEPRELGDDEREPLADM
jgi:hypothetical protein